MLIKTISFNAQLGSFKAVTVACEHCKELMATCEKFQRLLCKASVKEKELKQKKGVKWKLVICLLKIKTVEICVKCKLYIYSIVTSWERKNGRGYCKLLCKTYFGYDWLYIRNVFILSKIIRKSLSSYN